MQLDPWNVSGLSLDADLSAGGWAFLALIGSRLLGVFLTVPLFASRLIPFRFRLSMMCLLCLCLPAGLPLSLGLKTVGTGTRIVLEASGSQASDAAASKVLAGPGEALVTLASEVAVGACLGAFVLLIMAAVRGAAVLVSEQIGFSLGGVMDPLAEGSEPSLRSFHSLLAVFIFLCLDMHHVCLRYLAESFTVLPPGSLSSTAMTEGLGRFAVGGGKALFEAALLLALPVTAVLFLASLIHGILTRVIPELEFLVFGFPLRSFVGLAVTIVSLPFLARLFQGLYSSALENGRQFVRSLAG